MMVAMKRCSCGAEYDHTGWIRLPPASRGLYAWEMEWRNCHCGSTLAVDIE